MDKTNKTILAQAAETALLEGGLAAAKQVNEAIQQVEKKHQPNPDGTGNLDKPLLDELERTHAEQAGTEIFGTFGLDRATTEEYMRQLGHITGASRTLQIQIIQMIGQMAGEMGTTPQELFPIALAIFIRNKDIRLTQGILAIIAKYESQAPGIGVLQVAEKAAKGQPVGQEMMQIRMAFMALGGEYSSKGLTATKDLERAIYSIVAPQSKAGAEIMKTQEQRLRTQKSLEEWYTLQGRFQSLYSRQRLKMIENSMQWLVKVFPKFASMAPLDWWYRTLHGVASAAIIKQYVIDPSLNPVMQGPSPLQQMQQMGNPPLNSALGRGASLNVDHIVVAQAQRPTDLRQNMPQAPAAAPQGDSGTTQAPQGAQIPLADALLTANQANQANNAQVSDAARTMLPEFLRNTQIGQELAKLMPAFEVGQTIIDEELKTLQELIAMPGGTQYLGNKLNSAVYMTPQQFVTQAKRVYNLATQQKILLVAILNFLNQAVGDYTQGDPAQASLLQKLITDWLAKHVKVESNIVTAFELGLVGPIEQQIAMLEPQRAYLEQGIAMAAMINNIGAGQYVGPYSALCMLIGQLRMQASQQYMKVVSNPETEPQMKNYCLVRARDQMQQAMLVRREGAMAVMKMTQGIFGGQSLLPTSDYKGWIKVGSQDPVLAEIEREADAELEEYWNELYKDSPGAEGYGTALERALKYHNVPTDQVPPASPRMRRNTA